VIHWLLFNEHAELDFYSASSLKQQSADRHVVPLGQMLFLLNAACLVEKQQIPILESLVWPDRDSNPWSNALEASTLIMIKYNICTLLENIKFICNSLWNRTEKLAKCSIFYPFLKLMIQINYIFSNYVHVCKLSITYLYLHLAESNIYYSQLLRK
jgi:hypothetical protein